MRMVASAGQSLRMLWRATLRFSELNALVASARRMASLLSESRHLLAACTAASMPDNCPPQSWMQPDASWMSCLIKDRVALAIILRAVSPMPIGRTPGFLSSAMSRHARKGAIRGGLHRASW